MGSGPTHRLCWSQWTDHFDCDLALVLVALEVAVWPYSSPRKWLIGKDFPTSFLTIYKLWIWDKSELGEYCRTETVKTYQLQTSGKLRHMVPSSAKTAEVVHRFKEIDCLEFLEATINKAHNNPSV